MVDKGVCLQRENIDKFGVTTYDSAMKKIFRLTGLLLILAFTGPSCELLDDCKECKLVVYEDGVKVSETTGTTYCGEDLTAKEDADPVIVGNRRSVYECE